MSCSPIIFDNNSNGEIKNHEVLVNKANNDKLLITHSQSTPKANFYYLDRKFLE
ncbi:hypothetical protein GCM10023339_76090 [Alloalcanivorax gelatiniphagus]